MTDLTAARLRPAGSTAVGVLVPDAADRVARKDRFTAAHPGAMSLRRKARLRTQPITVTRRNSRWR